jgi:transposase-like protein
MMGGSGVVEADSLFVACPRCSAWPMAADVAVSKGGYSSRREMQFRCPRCGHQVTAQLTRVPIARGKHQVERTLDR